MKNSAISDFTWRDVQKELYTEEEIAESDLRVALISELIKARNEQGVSQKKLEEISGVKQPVIARIETGKSIPQVSTLIKLLVPLGKTLAIVPNKQDEMKKGFKIKQRITVLERMFHNGASSFYIHKKERRKNEKRFCID